MRCFSIDELLLKFPDISEEEIKHIENCEFCKINYEKSLKIYKKIDENLSTPNLSDLNILIIEKASQKLVQLGIEPNFSEIETPLKKNENTDVTDKFKKLINNTKKDEIINENIPNINPLSLLRYEKKNEQNSSKIVSFKKRAKIIQFFSIAAILVIGVYIGQPFLYKKSDMFYTSANALSGTFVNEKQSTIVISKKNESFEKDQSKLEAISESGSDDLDVLNDSIKFAKEDSLVVKQDISFNRKASGEGVVINAKIDYSKKSKKMDTTIMKKSYNQEENQSKNESDFNTKSITSKTQQNQEKYISNKTTITKNSENIDRNKSKDISINKVVNKTTTTSKGSPARGYHSDENEILAIGGAEKESKTNLSDDSNFENIELSDKKKSERKDEIASDSKILSGDEVATEQKSQIVNSKKMVSESSHKDSDNLEGDFNDKKYKQILASLENKYNLTEKEKKYLILSFLKLKKCDQVRKIENFRKYLSEKELEEFNTVCK